MEWPASMDEYEKLVIRMNTPRVVIDNAVCPVATVVKVDSARKRGVLLEAVQILADLELHISKAYISSDGRWFMDVFHVTDRHGRKLLDGDLLSHIEQSLATIGDASRLSDGRSDGGEEALTALELTGADRPGLLSEVFAVLADLQCGVSDARLWTHNGRIASVVFLKDDEPGSVISYPQKVHQVKARLRNVLKGDHGGGATTTTAVSSTSASHVDRRLHQLMFAICDHEGVDACSSSTTVSVQNWIERGYSVVTVQCRDRPKLLFDVVCTLTDMEYVVFHGTIDTNGDRAHQEFYIRHVDGSPISSEAERHRVIHCLQAAIERRASEGLRLELCSVDRRGFLADVTRVFRENGLSVLRAEVTAATSNDRTARNVFYVTDASGYPVDPKTIDAVIELVGPESIKVGELRPPLASEKLLDGDSTTTGAAALFYLGSIVKRNLYNLGLIRSCS